MTARTPVTYLVVAGFCLVLHNLILVAANGMSIPLWLAVLISFAAVASCGYALHAIFTFRQPLSISRLVRYATAMSANVPLAYLTTWFWYAAVGLPMLFAAPMGSVCMVVANFVLGRWAVAAPDPKTAGPR
ncbi:MAG TPA: GtrA family protein [Sphingomicrobium sp.]|jgi:putative flippase GtrA|nr:GtrA family protein [Sphingomicrobium sp.]